MEDREIVELFFRRDEGAVISCSVKYGALLRHIAYGILNNREDSEECENDTYLRAWNYIPPEEPVSLRAYLGRIVRNLALNYIEKRNASKRYGNTVLFSELEQMLPQNAGVEVRTEWEAVAARDNVSERMSEKELSELIAEWLRTLDAQDRIVFVRRYWYGEGLDELAAVFDTTAGRMSSRLFRLRERLRKFLEQEGVYL